MVAWTNAHGGFVAGLGILGVYACSVLAREIADHRTGWVARSTELVLVVIASAAATLVNPYGPGLLSWVWDSLTWPRPEISEWWPVPWWSAEYAAFKVLVVVTAVALGVSKRSHNWNHIAILALAASQAFLHRRHTPLFAILACIWVPEHFNDCLVRLRHWAQRRAAVNAGDVAPNRPMGVALLTLTVVFLSITATQLTTVRVEKATFPVAAFEFIEDRSLKGRMVTEFNWGQYCLYAFWPRILVSVDGRFDTSYSREVLDVNLDFIIGDVPKYRRRSPRTGAFRADRVLDLGDPNLALIDRSRSHCVRALEQRDDWVLLYQDAIAQLWGRRSVYDDAQSPDYLEPLRRSISDEAQAGWVAYPALPGPLCARERAASNGAPRSSRLPEWH
jgi:hypothetical protein